MKALPRAVHGLRASRRMSQAVDGFHVVAQESGFTGRSLPTWACRRPGNVKFICADEAPKASLRSLEHVARGCFQILDVLAPSECEQLIRITEQMGYDEDAPVSLPHSFRHMQNVNWIADASVAAQVWSRAAPALPEEAREVAPGAEALGLNARFRCYRYAADDYFKPHTDGSWPGSLVVDGKLVCDAFGDRWSQYTFLLLLSGDYEGGRTVFMVDGKQNAVRTPQGGALCFPHGGHPLHAVHAGELVTSGHKYMVRTEILYRRTAASDALQAPWIAQGSKL